MNLDYQNDCLRFVVNDFQARTFFLRLCSMTFSEISGCERPITHYYMGEMTVNCYKNYYITSYIAIIAVFFGHRGNYMCISYNIQAKLRRT